MQDKKQIRCEIITYLCGDNELSPKFIMLLKEGGLTEKDGKIIWKKLMDQLDSNYNLDLLFEEYYVEQLKNKDDYPAEEMRKYRRDKEYLQLLDKHFPQSVSEAVNIVIGMLEEDEIEEIKNQDKDTFCINQHFGWGLFMRNHFGINKGLAKSMLSEFSERPGCDFLLSDDISGYILEEVWDEVHKRFGDTMDLEKLFEECDEFYYNNDYEQILESYPDEQKAISYKGIALCFLDRYDEALEVLKNGIERYPENYYMKNNIAMVYYDLGDYEQSLKCCEEGLKIKDFDWLCENKIKALIRLDRMDDAIDFDKALNHESCRLEDILLEEEFSSQALNYYYGLLNENPEDIRLIDRIKLIICYHNLNLTPKVGDYYLKWINSIKKVNDTKKCPACGGELIPIIWGYPDSSLFEKADRDEVYLGGCVITDNTNVHCKSCQKNFSIPGIICGDTKLKEYVDFKIYIFNFIFERDSNSIKSLDEVKKELVTFTDEEFDRFIDHLKEINYIYEPRNGYISLVK